MKIYVGHPHLKQTKLLLAFNVLEDTKKHLYLHWFLNITHCTCTWAPCTCTCTCTRAQGTCACTWWQTTCYNTGIWKKVLRFHTTL